MRAKLIPALAATTIAYASAVTLANIATGITPANETSPENRGQISGVVVNAVTGKPVVGAYVGVGDFGDSGGSNYSRHRQQGRFARAQTDQQGRFELDGLAFQEHPLVVTHPEFVRHDQIVTVQEGTPESDIRVSLRPAAKINVAVVDSDGKSLQGLWLFRLEALDGRYFIPPGRDPHLSAFASSVWIERPKPTSAQKSLTELGTTGFSFTALDSGQYSIDVIKFTITDKYAAAPAGMTRLPLDTCNIMYYGGLAEVRVEAGQTKDVQIKPADYQTNVVIKMPEDPVKKPQIPPFVLISRNVGLLAWSDGKVHGPEDHRLGRLEKNALYYNAVLDGNVLTVENLPPGSYSVFAGPIYFMSAARMEVSSGQEIMVDVPPVQVTEQARVGLWTFNRRVKLEARDYRVSQLCELLSAKTDSNPRIVADPSIENKKLELADQEATIWDLMEAVYLAKGWKLYEHGERTLLLRPGP